MEAYDGFFFWRLRVESWRRTLCIAATAIRWRVYYIYSIALATGDW